MKKLKFINSLGAELEITNAAPFVLTSFDTTNNVNIYNSKNMNQDGANYLGNTLDIRDIPIEVTIVSNSNQEGINNRNKLNKIFNPKLGEGWLVYTDDAKEVQVKCISNKLPYYAPDNDNFVQDCLISLTANDPYWKELQEIRTDIALWLGDFEFPLELTADGIELGHRAPSLIVNVLNDGDVECGMRIVFKALATLTNPSLFNVNTREYIKINKAMVAGETITITTDFGNKKIIDNLNGIETNAVNSITDPNITFLQLAVGDNLFRYDADTGIDNLECEIYFIPKYLGV